MKYVRHEIARAKAEHDFDGRYEHVRRKVRHRPPFRAALVRAALEAYLRGGKT